MTPALVCSSTSRNASLVTCIEEVFMSIRKMIIVSIVAVAAIVPLVGCNGGDSGGAADMGGSDTSHTTVSE